jgi:hypothetical protein
MPLNDADRAWIRQEIQAAHKRQGLGKLTGFIKDWSGAGAAVAILILAFAKWEAYVEFRTNTNTRLGIIEKTLAEIRGDLARRDLISQAALSLQDFKASLPDLSSAIIAARQQKVRIAPKVIEDLQVKLSGSADAPNFWPAAAQFIDYRSFNSTASDLTNLPACTDRDPGGMKIDSITPETSPDPSTVDKGKTPVKMVVENAQYADCALTLDSPEQADKLNWILRHRTNRITFTRCLIIYHGGPINITLEFNNEPRILYWYDAAGKPQSGSAVTVSGPTLAFVDCFFNFVFVNPPSEPGRSFAKSVLTQNGSSIVLQGSATHS